jgi:N-methylhydantoinase B
VSALRDVLQFEELRTELQAIADDMAIRFARSSRSPVIREYLDFSTAICLPDGRMVAQGFSLPLHLGAVPRAVGAVLYRFPDGLSPGDLAIVNDPYHGGMHLPDVFTVAPAYVDSKLVGYVVVVAHHIDIGGRVAGGSAADSRSIFEEGLRLPPVLLDAGGARNTELELLLRENVRIPEILLSDLNAQAAGCTLGGQALADLAERHGLDEYRGGCERILTHGRRSLESELRTWPEGVYEFEDAEDHDGFGDNPVRIKVRVTVRDGGITLDFTGSAAQVPGSINATLSFTESASYAAIRSLVSTDMPVNAGFLERIEVIAPAGSVLNATFPAGVAARGVLGYRVIEVVYGALAVALPDRVPAAGDGGTSGIRFGGIRNGALFQANDIVCGAWGARPHGDGVDGAANMAANVANRSVEQIERDDPLQVLGYGFVSDSGGAGKHRGGLAVRRVLELTADEAMLNLRTHRNVTPPFGLNGGHPGQVSQTWLVRDGERTLLPAKVTIPVRRGDVIEHRTASGGGWGDPRQRAPEQVLADLEDDKVSEQTAREVYGVSTERVAGNGSGSS